MSVAILAQRNLLNDASVINLVTMDCADSTRSRSPRAAVDQATEHEVTDDALAAMMARAARKAKGKDGNGGTAWQRGQRRPGRQRRP